MTGKDFFMNESMGWKFVYALGFALVVIHLVITFTLGDHNYRLLPLFGFTGLATFFFRFAKAKKNLENK